MYKHRISVTAYAEISGSTAFPNIRGAVTFRQTPYGVMVNANVIGLPASDDGCAGKFLGFHIHSGGACTGDEKDPFADALSHYNPGNCTHPFHAGDLPPLLSAGGHAISACLTDRFSVSEIIGKTVVIHSAPDDFTTQPAGNSGIKIACGVIKAR